MKFQLHHTGIKTLDFCVVLRVDADFNCTIQELKHEGVLYNHNAAAFQLHHTGIKTLEAGFTLGLQPGNFNCTIQELKHLVTNGNYGFVYNFNCTIQELKRKPWRT